MGRPPGSRRRLVQPVRVNRRPPLHAPAPESASREPTPPDGPGSALARIAASLDVPGSSWDRVVRIGLEELGGTLGAARGRALLLDSARDGLETAGRWSRGEPAKARTFQELVRRDQGTAGRSWTERRVVVERPTEEPATASPVTRLALPLVAGGSVWGVIELEVDGPAHVEERAEEMALAGRILGEALARIRVEDRLADLTQRTFVVVLGRPGGEVRGPVDASDGAPYAIAYASPSFCRMTGFTDAELQGRSLRAIMGPRTDRAVLDSLRNLLESPARGTLEFVAYRKDGSQFPLRVQVSPILDRQGRATHFVIAPPDLLAAKAMGAIRQSEGDPLTGLANRSLMQDALRRAIERWEKNRSVRFALLFIDLDGFKEINDTLGHMAGDELLVQVARQLEGAVRPGDLVARFGGDEFVILLDLVGGLRDVALVAERIADRLRMPMEVAGRGVQVSGSIGVALSDTGYRTAEAALRDADLAMYQAKEAGGGGYRVFDTDLQAVLSASDRTRTALQQAIQAGGLRLHYQPIVELSSGRITGFEALARLDQAERGLLRAAEFIEQAEESGLILALGRWVLGEACRQAGAWRSLRPDRQVTVSVNVSEAELRDRSLPETLTWALQASGTPPAILRLEIPERFLARPPEETEPLLRRLREVGASVGVGDFGRGHAPLPHLARASIDFVKLSPALLVEAATGGEAERALRSALALAGGLAVETTAAGVETEQQRLRLDPGSCPYAQGTLFCDAVEAGAAAALLEGAP